MIIAKYRKYEKAKKHSRLARMGCSLTYLTIYQLIPTDMLEALSSRQIGALVDLLYKQKQYGENEMLRELKPHLKPLTGDDVK